MSHTFRQYEMLQAILAELIGTFFLTLAALIGGTPFAVALTLAALVYILGDISGCHVNPAVTVGLMVIRRCALKKGVFYIIAQICGALLARLIASLIGPLPGHYASGDFVAEFFGVGCLILAVAATTAKIVPKPAAGIAIGSALGAGLLISNGVLNPAVAIAMGLILTPATWAVLLGGILLALLSQLFLPATGPQSPSPLVSSKHSAMTTGSNTTSAFQPVTYRSNRRPLQK